MKTQNLRELADVKEALPSGTLQQNTHNNTHGMFGVFVYIYIRSTVRKIVNLIVLFMSLDTYLHQDNA